jgi:hypothetical protein
MDNLNSLEATILRILEGHQGRDNSVSRRDLVERVNDHCSSCADRRRQGYGDQEASEDMPLFPARRSLGIGGPVHEREIRRVIKHLVEQHATWIGSGAKGYFLIQTDQELLAACKYYHGYAMSLLHVEAKLRKMSLPALLGQLSIEFGAGLEAAK